MSANPEWGLVTVTEDLMAASRDLAQLAWEFGQEARSWTVPAGREQLQLLQAHLTTWAQEAALASAQGDYYTRLEAVQLAHHRREAARLSLRTWWERGELWNSHRLRPIPASIGRDWQ